MPPRSLLDMVPAHRAVVTAIRQLYPDETDDDLVDTIFGESDLPDAIFAALRLAEEDEMMVEGLDQRIKTLAERKARLAARAQSTKSICLHAIQEAGIKPPLRAPDMTVSVGRGKAKLIITDESKVPDALCKIERTPKKKEIAAWLNELDPMSKPAWVTLGNPQPFLTVHRK